MSHRRSGFGSFAEPLEERVLMAMSLKLGGSGYSNLLATDSAAVRQQKLICDPPEPLAGSTSTQYNPKQVTIVGAQPGPGYDNERFLVLVGVGDAEQPQLQPLDEFLREPRGPETGYVQVHYALSGEAGKIAPPRDWIVLDVGGTEGADTHALDFLRLEDVSPDEPINYRTFAARAGEFGNAEDFLITNDGSETRLGPDDLWHAEATTRPGDGSVSGTVFNDRNRNGTFDEEDEPQGDVVLFLDLDRDGKFGVEPSTQTNELGIYFFDGIAPGEYVIGEVVPEGFEPLDPKDGLRPIKIEAGPRLREQNFANVVPRVNQPPTATPILTPVTPGGAHHWFKVAYTDDVSVNWQSINTGDVQVTGPGGYSQLGTLSNLGFAGGTWTTTYRVPAPGGSWNLPDNGTYTVSMRPGQVSDNEGAFVPAGTLGSFVVQLGDFANPTAVLNSAPTITAPGATHYWFKIDYADDVAVQYQSIGSGDVLVTGPNGYSQLGTLSNLSFANNKWTATYRVPGPGGSWDGADNGSYGISMRAGEVSDTSGKFVAAGALGSFAVRLADNILPTAQLQPSNVRPGATHHWFNVNYSDDVGINYTTIGSGDVGVTGPGGYSQLGVLSNLTFAGGTWTATYRVPAPGGTWDAADNGTYAVSMRTGEVRDTFGNAVPAGTLGSFSAAFATAGAAGPDAPLLLTGAAEPATRWRPARRAADLLA